MKYLLQIFLFALCLIQTSTSQTHPRLFYGPADISTIQSRATTSGTPAYEIWQLIKSEQADWFTADAHWPELVDGFVMENALAVSLAYVITADNTYLTASKNIIFGAGSFEGLLNITSTDTFLHVTRASTLSTMADVLWNSLTVNERIQIGQAVYDDVTNYVHPTVFQSWYHINNNALTREGSSLAVAAITFYDLLDGYGNLVYPGASSDLDRVRSLVVTNLNGNKNIIERLYDSEGSQFEGFEYSLVGLTRILPLVEALNRFDGADYFNSTEIQKRLSKVAHWLAYEIVPAPRSIFYFVNNINDSDVGSGDFDDNGNGLLTTVLGLGGYYQTSTTRWDFENTVQNISNLQTSPDIYYQRYSKVLCYKSRLKREKLFEKLIVYLLSSLDDSSGRTVRRFSR